MGAEIRETSVGYDPVWRDLISYFWIQRGADVLDFVRSPRAIGTRVAMIERVFISTDFVLFVLFGWICFLPALPDCFCCRRHSGCTSLLFFSQLSKICSNTIWFHFWVSCNDEGKLSIRISSTTRRCFWPVFSNL